MSNQSPELIHARPVPRPSVWIAAGIVTLLGILLIHSLITNENFRWDIVWAHMFDARVIRGIGWTLVLTVISMVIGIVLAVSAAVARMSNNPILKGVAWAYIWFFRGTPIYTQLMFWGMIGVLYPTMGAGLPFGETFFEFRTYDLFTPVVCAIIGLGLNEGAYLSEIVRSGLNSVDKGQWEASTALGMKRSTTLRRIIVPQAMRVIVPPTGNETISMLKTTSLVLAVPFTLDLTFVTNAIGNRLFLPLPLLIVAVIWYLVITSILMVGQARLEAYYGKGFDEESGNRKSAKKMSKRQQAILAGGTVNDRSNLDVTP